MSKIRIYELARELGVDNKDVITCAQRLGMADKSSHSNSLEDYEADSIRRMLLRRALGVASDVAEVSAISPTNSSSGGGLQLRGGVPINRPQDGLKFTTRPGIEVRRSGGGALHSQSTPLSSSGSHAVEIRSDNVIMRRRRPDSSSNYDVHNEALNPIPLVNGESVKSEEIHREDVLREDVLPTLDNLFIQPKNDLAVSDQVPVKEASPSTVPLFVELDSEEADSVQSSDLVQSLDHLQFSHHKQSDDSPLSETLDAESFTDSEQLDTLVESDDISTTEDRCDNSDYDDSESSQVSLTNQLEETPPNKDSVVISVDDQQVGTNIYSEALLDEPFEQEEPFIFESSQQEEELNSVDEIKQTVKNHYEDTFLSNFQTETKSLGPKVLGKIDLATKKIPKVEVKINKEVEGKKWKMTTFSSDTVLEDEDEADKRTKKSRVKRREFSRNDLVDYDVTENKRLKARGGSHKSRHSQAEKAAKHEFTGPKASKRVVKVDEFITVGELAKNMSLKSSEIISKLLSLGVMATINQLIDKDTATIVAEEFEYQVESVSFDEIQAMGHDIQDNLEDLEPRSPVVTVMGHVDHGKTSLLDSIRSSSVATKEHGGITQHIGAYQVMLSSGKKITFIDTPGHEAFTSMRARGAQVTDIVILVVAADDGVMPQTVEAINHAKAADVSIVVAVNKMDRPDANADKVKQQLSELGLQPEDWGGDTMYFPVSAIKKEGIEELLEGILLLAEIKELKANYKSKVIGTVLEATQERGLGTVATVLVQRGTLSLGEIFVSGAEYGRVRSMTNDLAERMEQAFPSQPVQITGFNGVPTAGDDFIVVDSESDAREIARNRAEKIARIERAIESVPITLEELSRRTAEAAVQELNVILKSDVHGTAEAVKSSVERLSSEKVRVRVLHSAVGGINESDIQLAIASRGIVIGFGVRAEPRAMTLAESLGVEVRFYRVIYELLDDVEKAMVGLLAPDKQEVPLGRLEVRDTFSVPKIGVIAGGYVSDGIVKRGAFVRVLRDSRVVFEGKMGSLRRFKEDVKQVQSGYECGLGVENFNDIKVGDVVEIYEFKEVAPTLH
jgi:translation initiation factor IF-2